MSRVLIVDDEPNVCEVLREFLTRVGDEVATAATGTAALDLVPTFQPDVILLDMVMPGMSGADVLDALERSRVSVPVIVISGHLISPPAGAFAYLRKPFDLRKVADLVTAAVGATLSPHASLVPPRGGRT